MKSSPPATAVATKDHPFPDAVTYVFAPFRSRAASCAVLYYPSVPTSSVPSADESALDGAYHNRSTGAITVPFLLSEEGRVRLTVFDVLGREVAVLADEFRSAGPHAVGFDGSILPSGAYFYRLEVEGAGVAQTRPLTILR